MKGFLALAMLVGCVGCTTSLESTTEPLLICEQSQCTSLSSASTGQLLNKLHQLFESNSGEASICSADAVTHQCSKPEVCYFVLGGVLPGSGCSNRMTLSDITQSGNQLIMRGKMPLTFIGTPVKCKIANASLSLDSANKLSLQLSPHFCSWMVMGVMTAQLNFNIDWVNLDTNEIGGFWSHSVKGTGNGSGSGYMILQFSNQSKTQGDLR